MNVIIDDEISDDEIPDNEISDDEISGDKICDDEISDDEISGNQNSDTLGEDIRSHLNGNRREDSEMTAETARVISSELPSQMVKK